jgi:[acyl-carrier-protein] S-malonyltransferase
VIDWLRSAFLFPGQNSQYVGMGADFYAEYPVSRQIFDQADDILGFKLSKLMFEGDEATLNETINTQPAVYVCSVAMLRALQQEAPLAKPFLAAGHSLGELTALTAGNSLSFEDGVRLVRERGRLMTKAGDVRPGAMAALLGMDLDAVEAICLEATQYIGEVVVVANDNCPGQVVISGFARAVDYAIDLAQASGVKKAVRLAVSVAAHSPLMSSVTGQFSNALGNTPFKNPENCVYSNASGVPMIALEDIRFQLNRQLTHSVRWRECIEVMIRDSGATLFIEIGPGDVLSGMVKRINRDVARVTINSVASLRTWVQSLGG